MVAPIDRFDGPYRFLSNFSPCQPPGIQLHFGLSGEDRRYYPTVEHAYQASKTNNPGQRDVIWASVSAGYTKRCGRSVTLRPDWERVKEDIMLHLLKQKFRHNPLRQRLLDTGDAELIEGNTWGDTYWGKCNGVGRNALGNLLELVRFQLNHPEMYPELVG